MSIFCFFQEKQYLCTMKMNFLPDKKQRTVWLRAFGIWQHRPHELAPNDELIHTCQSCGTIFQGNYCPRCGQSSKIGRFSFKTAFLLFLDVWGMGNRGMFRSIRDLMLRPGYMIRDYLIGRQSAYFPPFKMFFILTAFELLLSHGFNLGLDEMKQEVKQDETKVENTIKAENSMKADHKGIKVNGQIVDNPGIRFVEAIPIFIGKLEEKSPALSSFILLVLVSAPLYLFFRRCPAIPDLRYSEHLVSLVYTSNVYILYSMLAELLSSSIIKLVAVAMIFVALKQFTGYSKRRLLLYIFLTALIFIVIIAILGSLFYVFFFPHGE